MNVLTSAGPTRLALLINEAIMEPIKALWQTFSSQRGDTTSPPKGLEHLYTPPALDILVVAVANEWERQGLKEAGLF